MESQNLQANGQVQVASTEGRNFRNNHLGQKRPRDNERKVNTMTTPTYSRLCDVSYNCGALGRYSKECQALRRLAERRAQCYYYGKIDYAHGDYPEQ